MALSAVTCCLIQPLKNLMWMKLNMTEGRSLAIVKDASTGSGYKIAKCCAQNGFGLVIAANEPKIMEASREL